MKIAVTTPTGNIGSKLAERLLAEGAEIAVLARHPQKVSALAQRGARVVEGDQLDLAAVNRLLEGADALFWLTPDDLSARKMREHYNRFGDVAAQALRARPDLPTVHLSSVGAQLSDGTGPIKGLHDVEQKLNAVASNVTHLRANYFMENILTMLPQVAGQGGIFSTIPGEKSLPQIATRDIAECAAQLLLHPQHGRHVVDAMGPEEIAFKQVAGTLSEVLGKPVKYMQIPALALGTGMMQAGLSNEVTGQLLEMYEAISDGRLDALVGDTQWKGHTRFEQFAREVVAPVFKKMSSAA